MPFTIEQLQLRVQEVKINCAGQEVQTYELNLSGEYIDKGTMQNIKDMLQKNLNITSLNFSSCKGMQDPYVASLIPSLLGTVKYLNFENTKVEWYAGDAAKKMFAERNLRKIILANAGITDWFINQHTLWGEDLVRTQVQDLDLRNNQITDEGAEKLEKRIWGCNVPNTALTHLQVGGNPMTPEMIKRLEERVQLLSSPYLVELEAEQRKKKKETDRVEALIAKYGPKKQQIIDFFSAFWFEQLSKTTITLKDIETLTRTRTASMLINVCPILTKNIEQASSADILRLAGTLIENTDVPTLKTFLKTFLEDLRKARYDEIHCKDRVLSQNFMNELYERNYNFFNPIGQMMHQNAEGKYKVTLTPPVYGVDSPLPGYEGEVKSQAEDVAVVVHQQVPARLPEETDGSMEIKLTAETVKQTIDVILSDEGSLNALYQLVSAQSTTGEEHSNKVRILLQREFGTIMRDAPRVFETRKQFDEWLSDASELIDKQCKELYGISGIQTYLIQGINMRLFMELNPTPVPAPVVAFHPRPSESLADRAERERKLQKANEEVTRAQNKIATLQALLRDEQQRLVEAQEKVQKRTRKLNS